MMFKLGMMAVFAVCLLAVAPASAEVKTLNLDETSYDKNDKVVFTGKATPSEQFVIKVIKDDDRTKGTIKFIQAKADAGGDFETLPIKSGDIFKRGDRIYNVTVIAGGGDTRQDGVTLLQVQVKDDTATKYTPPVKKLVLELKDVRLKIDKTAVIPIKLAAGSEQGAAYSIVKRPSGTDGAVITQDGKFVWTPTKSHASYKDNPYTFTIQAKKGSLVATDTITVTVEKAHDAPPVTPVAKPAPKPVQVEFTLDPAKEPQSYVDRYTNEPSYKAWFDKNYPQYTSIYEAVGLEAPKKLAPFVKEGVKPQTYVDRYNNEPSYKAWFDKTYPEYSSIYEAVGLEEPMPIAPFVKDGVDPQNYVDRYNNEPSYKSWFEKTYPQYTSIYEAVGLKEVSAEPDAETRAYGSCGTGTMLVDETCMIPTEKQ
ncbi:MAG: hypothetical protein D9C04_07160, partial [Nitrosopumilus sp. B06]